MENKITLDKYFHYSSFYFSFSSLTLSFNRGFNLFLGWLFAQRHQVAQQIFLLFEVSAIPIDVIPFLLGSKPVILREADADELHKVSHWSAWWAPIFDEHLKENVRRKIDVLFQMPILLVVDRESPEFSLLRPLNHFF